MNVMTSITAPAGPIGFSTADFQRMIESGAFEDMWVELIGGEIQRMPPPGRTHGQLQMAVVFGLGAVAPRRRVFGDIGIELADGTVVGADAALLAREGGTSITLAADEVLLAVEIAVSTRDRDLGLKRRLYAAAGVPHYWVVDAERALVHVFDRPEGGDYLGLSLTRFGEPLAVPGAEGTITLD